ncbi:uncharacterized protein AUP68_09900 [Ilyonectria robusta]
MILDHPESIGALSQHPVDPDDLVLLVAHPVQSTILPKQFETRFDLGLSDFERKVNAVCNFSPSANPTNPSLFGLDPNSKDPIPDSLATRLSLHRALLRGQGFWKVMLHGPRERRELEGNMGDLRLEDKKSMHMARLPVINLLDKVSESFIAALMEEALVVDRGRFQKYLTTTRLGLAIITAGPGFGKTTALALATVGLATSRKNVFASAPTHVAADNFAARLDTVATRVTDRYNKRVRPHERRRRMLVVRVYKESEEFDAFMNLLSDPHKGDDASPRTLWGNVSKWKLHLSVAYWLLVCLDSPAARPIHVDDCKALHDIRREIMGNEDLRRLHQVASGTITWEEYHNGKTVARDTIEHFLLSIIDRADIICAVPSLAFTQPSIANWKNKVARGISVDEAASINRPDLYAVWGNTFLPCLLAGDEKQLALGHPNLSSFTASSLGA